MICDSLLQILFLICLIPGGVCLGALDGDFVDLSDLYIQTDAAVVWLVIVVVVGIIYVIIFILLRFINVKLLNENILIVLIMVR